ncbi:MAG: biotin transporter BioY [Bauldia sp.]
MATPSATSALAPSLWPARTNAFLRDVVLVVLGSLLIAASAKIQVPFWPVPMTLQTLAVMVIPAAYGLRVGLATVVAYLAEGLAGLPVFAGAAAGPAYFLGPTGGFLAGFIVAAAIIGYATDRGWDRSTLRLGAAMAIGDALIFAAGFAWLAWFATVSAGQGVGTARAFAGGVQPFILGDVVKVALGALAVPAVWRLVDRRRLAP